MEVCSRYTVGAIQTNFGDAFNKDTVGRNLKRCGELIDWVMFSYSNLGFPVKLIAFPEFVIQGIPYVTKNDLMKNDIPVHIPGEETSFFREIAQKYDIYIETGSLLEYDAKYPGHVFNTACIVGPEGIVLKYRKVQTWVPVEVFSSPHDIKGYEEPLFPVANTSIGKLAVGICYDFMFPEIPREYALKGAEVMIRSTAYPPPWGEEMPTNWMESITQVRSIENVCYNINVNLGGSSCGLMYNGGTIITDYEGRVLSRTNHGGEQLVIAHFNLDELREFRANSHTHNFVSHIRANAYSYLNRPMYPGDSLDKNEDNSFDHRVAMIREARDRIYDDLRDYIQPERAIGPNLVYPGGRSSG